MMQWTDPEFITDRNKFSGAADAMYYYYQNAMYTKCCESSFQITIWES